jgi:hypothetical protein
MITNLRYEDRLDGQLRIVEISDQCCISCVGEIVDEGPEYNFSATSAENVGICRQDLKKIQKQSFFSIFLIFLNL